MTKAVNYRKLTALCAVVALTLVQSVFAVSPNFAGDDPDLNSELRTIDSYANDLVAYKRACAQLAKKPSLLSADVEPVQRNADDLKRRLSDVQTAIREVVRKLKAANQWDDLDATVVSRLNQASIKSQFQQRGLKSLLEDSAANLNSRASDLSGPVDSLRKKIARMEFTPSRGEALFVKAGYVAPVPFEFQGLDCTFQKVRVGLLTRFGRNATPAVGDMSCACGGSMNIITGEDCK